MSMSLTTAEGVIFRVLQEDGTGTKTSLPPEVEEKEREKHGWEKLSPFDECFRPVASKDQYFSTIKRKEPDGLPFCRCPECIEP